MKSVEKLLQDIREIESLDRHIKEHLDHIQEQNKRIEFLNMQREQKTEASTETQETIKEKQTELTAKENELVKVDSQLEKTINNLSAVTTEQQLKSLESEKLKFAEAKDSLETEVFDLMETLETKAEELRELQEFLEGSAQTLKELEAEVHKSTTKDEIEIQQYQKRVNAIFNELQDPLKTKYGKARNKHRFKEPATYLITDNCPKCGLAVSPSKKNDILYLKSIETCSGCRRVFIPS